MLVQGWDALFHGHEHEHCEATSTKHFHEEEEECFILTFHFSSAELGDSEIENAPAPWSHFSAFTIFTSKVQAADREGFYLRGPPSVG